MGWFISGESLILSPETVSGYVLTFLNQDFTRSKNISAPRPTESDFNNLVFRHRTKPGYDRAEDQNNGANDCIAADWNSFEDKYSQ